MTRIPRFPRKPSDTPVILFTLSLGTILLGSFKASIADELAIPKRVNKVAKITTVRIETPGSPGSGVIIRNGAGGCTILTADHVVSQISNGETGKIWTDEQTGIELARPAITSISGTDMAVIQISSQCIGRGAAILGSMFDINLGDELYASGFSANVSPEISNASFRISSGRLLSTTSQYDGYSLTYSSKTVSGMSGGPIFNKAGLLVGIHGRGETLGETGTKVSALGMPINIAEAFLSRRPTNLFAPTLQPNSAPTNTRCPGVVC